MMIVPLERERDVLEQLLRDMIAVDGQVTIRHVVHVPQLDTLGERLMAGLQAIVDMVEAQNNATVQLTEAMVEQGQAIVEEMQELGQAGHVDPAQVTALAGLMQEHVTALEQQTRQVRANTDQIKAFVTAEEPPPDERPPGDGVPDNPDAPSA